MEKKPIIWRKIEKQSNPKWSIQYEKSRRLVSDKPSSGLRKDVIECCGVSIFLHTHTHTHTYIYIYIYYIKEKNF